jgi:hypothetical protein
VAEAKVSFYVRQSLSSSIYPRYSGHPDAMDDVTRSKKKTDTENSVIWHSLGTPNGNLLNILFFSMSINRHITVRIFAIIMKYITKTGPFN